MHLSLAVGSRASPAAGRGDRQEPGGDLGAVTARDE
jgi:hypothetical protein